MSYKKYSAYGLANETVSKSQQIVMLYDGIIKFTRRARAALEENKIEDRFNNLQRACKILLGLQSSLDFENGGRIAHILNNFYAQTDIRLMALNQSKSLADCDLIIEDLKKMRDTWAEIGATMNNSQSNVPANAENAPANLESIAVSI